MPRNSMKGSLALAVIPLVLLVPSFSSSGLIPSPIIAPAARRDPGGGTSIHSHRMVVEVFPERHALKVSDTMDVRSQSPRALFRLNTEFSILGVSVNRHPVDFIWRKTSEPKDSGPSGELEVRLPGPGDHTVRVDYEGVLFDRPKASRFTREYVASQSTAIISAEGTFLSPESWWYPRAEEHMSRFEVLTLTPEGYETVTQGARIRHEILGAKLHIRWKNAHPSDVLYLQAGPYTVQEDTVDGIAVYTYFFPGDEGLSKMCLEKSQQYIAMYSRLLGRYPYDKFAVVENFFETGYGMPSWTLLGRTVLRLPFIPDTSLPHEICHNWWGNGVFVEESGGNWCEGLTVFCSDYLLKKASSPHGGMDYRRQINRDYSSYVRMNTDFPLRKFRARHDPATRAVGYGKAMMVFHQLERMVGEDRFFQSLRRLMREFRFRKASWKDVLGVFEAECGVNLRAFHAMWVERQGAPVLRLEKADIQKAGERFILRFQIRQEGDPYTLDVPVLLKTEEKDILQTFRLTRSLETFEISSAAPPVRLEVDPEHHLFRRLYPEEIPPSIGKVFGDEKQVLVVPGSGPSGPREACGEAARIINRTGTGVIREDTDIAPEEMDRASVILIGSASTSPQIQPFLKSVFRDPPWEKKRGESARAARVLVLDHPKSHEHAVMILTGGEKADLPAIARKLPHYGKYSYLLFDGDVNVAKGIWEVESSPLILSWAPPSRKSRAP